MSTVLTAFVGLLTELDSLPGLTPRFTDPLSVDVGTDFETLGCLLPRDCGHKKFGTRTQRIGINGTLHGFPPRGRLASTTRFMEPLSVDGGTDLIVSP